MVRTKSWMEHSSIFPNVVSIFSSSVISHGSLITDGCSFSEVASPLCSSSASTFAKSLPRTNIFVYFDCCNSDVKRERPIPSVPPAMNSYLPDFEFILLHFCKAEFDNELFTQQEYGKKRLTFGREKSLVKWAMGKCSVSY